MLKSTLRKISIKLSSIRNDLSSRTDCFGDKNNELHFEIGLVDEIWGIDEAIAYAAEITELEDYQVEYYGQKLSPEELLIKELLENFDISIAEPEVLSALSGIANLYETLVEIKQPKALLTCQDCMIDLD